MESIVSKLHVVTVQRMETFPFPLAIQTLVLLTLFFIVTKWPFHKPSETNNSPPSPPKLPILGNLHQFGRLPHRDLQRLAKKHGPIMLLHLGRVPALIVSSSRAAREVMTTHDLALADRPELRITKQLLYDYKDVIFSPYGEQWRQRRGICVFQLLNRKRVTSFRTIMEDETALLAKRIRQSPRAINLSQMVMEVANDVICRAALGRKCQATLGRKSDEVKKGGELFPLLKEFLELLGTAFVGDFIPWLSWIGWVTGLDARVDEAVKEMDMFLEEVIQAATSARKNPEEKDNGDHDVNRKTLVDVLLDSCQNESTNASMDRDSVKAIIMEVIVAGTNSSSSVLEWSMSELLRHPQIMRRLQDEVRGVMSDNCNITQNDLEKMLYLKAVIKETLRLHTPVPLTPRIARQDVQFMQYNVPAGTMVFTNIWAIAMDPNTWDKPETFNPDRFINSSVNFKAADFDMIPFGGGRRGCPATTFAMAVTELMLANLVHKFNWRLAEEMKELDMTELPGVVIHRAVPLIAVASAV